MYWLVKTLMYAATESNLVNMKLYSVILYIYILVSFSPSVEQQDAKSEFTSSHCKYLNALKSWIVCVKYFLCRISFDVLLSFHQMTLFL